MDDVELLQILQAEKKAQGNAEKLLPEPPLKAEIKEENVLKRKEINTDIWTMTTNIILTYYIYIVFYYCINVLDRLILFYFARFCSISHHLHEGISYIFYNRTL